MFKIWFLVLLVLCLIGIVSAYLILIRLKKEHPKKWSEIGSPTLFYNNSIENNLKVTRFMWRNEYRELNDPYLNRMIASQKILFIIYVVLFALFISALILKELFRL